MRSVREGGKRQTFVRSKMCVIIIRSCMEYA
jgi:hypothetical protein